MSEPASLNQLKRVAERYGIPCHPSMTTEALKQILEFFFDHSTNGTYLEYELGVIAKSDAEYMDFMEGALKSRGATMYYRPRTPCGPPDGYPIFCKHFKTHVTRTEGNPMKLEMLDDRSEWMQYNTYTKPTEKPAGGVHMTQDRLGLTVPGGIRKLIKETRAPVPVNVPMKWKWAPTKRKFYSHEAYARPPKRLKHTLVTKRDKNGQRRGYSGGGTLHIARSLVGHALEPHLIEDVIGIVMDYINLAD